MDGDEPSFFVQSNRINICRNTKTAVNNADKKANPDQLIQVKFTVSDYKKLFSDEW